MNVRTAPAVVATNTRVIGATTMVARRTADRTQVAESTKNASDSWLASVPRNATNRPAIGKPRTSAKVSAVHVALLATITSSSLTMRGRKATLAGRKKRLTAVTATTSG